MCRFLYIWRYFKYIVVHVLTNVPEVWTIFVRTVFFSFLGIFVVLNGPPPTPSPASMSKFPSGGEKYIKNIGKYWFSMFLIEKMVLKWLRRIAFVWWDVAEASLGRVPMLKSAGRAYHQLNGRTTDDDGRRWTEWCFKGHFFDGDWLFLCFSVCYLLY